MTGARNNYSEGNPLKNANRASAYALIYILA